MPTETIELTAETLDKLKFIYELLGCTDSHADYVNQLVADKAYELYQFTVLKDAQAYWFRHHARIRVGLDGIYLMDANGHEYKFQLVHNKEQK